MNKLNKVLINYLSLNGISLISIIYILIIIEQAFFYLINHNKINSFYNFYGLIMNLIDISQFFVVATKLLMIGFLFEIIVKFFFKYEFNKLNNNRIYLTLFYFGLLLTFLYTKIYFSP